MAERLCCSKGHRWEPVFPPDVWPPDFRSDCPVCGAPPVGPFDVTTTTAVVMTVLAVVLFLVGLPLLLLSADTLPFGVIALVIAAIFPLAGLVVWANRRKARKMAAVADEMGFAFLPHLTLSSVRAVAAFRLFTLGHSQKAYNGLQGRVGDCDVLFFEYQYTIGSGKSSQTHTHSIVLVFDGAAGVPDFQLAPKTFMDKIVGFFTHSSIEFEDAAEFSRRCKLTGPDQAALRRTFHPDLLEFFARDGRWFIQAADGQLLLYRTPALRPDRCPGLVTDALDVRDLLREAGRAAR